MSGDKALWVAVVTLYAVNLSVRVFDLSSLAACCCARVASRILGTPICLFCFLLG